MSIDHIIGDCRQARVIRRKLKVVRSAFLESDQSYEEGLSLDPKVVNAFKTYLGIADSRKYPEAVVFRAQAEKHLKDSFLGAISPERFNIDFHALYCSRKVGTANAERRELVRRRIAQGRRSKKTTNYTNFVYVIVGDKSDLKEAFVKFEELRSDDHAVCQIIGKNLRDDGIRSIVYPSLRHIGGENTCTFEQSYVQAVGITSLTRVDLNEDHNGIESMKIISAKGTGR